MKNLSAEARLIEIVVRRVLRLYAENMTYTHRNNHIGAMEEAISKLPRIVQNARKKVERRQRPIH